MKKKCTILSICSFVIALAIYSFTYILFHYLRPEGGFSAVFQKKPAKPFVTLLFGIWGVMFHFASVMSLLIGKIFFSEKRV